MPGEFVSETREGMDNIADAIRTLAGAVSSLAAGAHTNTPGTQRDMASVIYEDATRRFAEITKKMDQKTMRELDTYIHALCKPKK